MKIQCGIRVFIGVICAQAGWLMAATASAQVLFVVLLTRRAFRLNDSQSS